MSSNAVVADNVFAGSCYQKLSEHPAQIFHFIGLLIQWSVKVECWMEDSTFGMWQVVQFFVLTGQVAPR